MFDGTVNLKIWSPSEKSEMMTVKRLKEIIEDLDDEFTVTISDMNWVSWEIDCDERRIDFEREYKDGA